MKYRNIFLLTIGLLLSLAVHAQKLTVESMQVTNNLSASQYRRADLNGEPCGFVKVCLTVVGATFEGSVIQPLTTFNLTLVMQQTGGVVQTQKLTINYTPTNAIVLVDSKTYTGNGHVELALPVGSHDSLNSCRWQHLWLSQYPE